MPSMLPCDFLVILYHTCLGVTRAAQDSEGPMLSRVIALSALVLAATLGLSIPAHSQSPAVPTPPGGLESPIGRVEASSGSVTIQRTAIVVRQAALSSGTVQPKAGDVVYRGDVIQTGADGKLSLTFADGTAFNVSSNARMELNEFVYNPDGKSNS